MGAVSNVTRRYVLSQPELNRNFDASRTLIQFHHDCSIFCTHVLHSIVDKRWHLCLWSLICERTEESPFA